MEIYVSLARSKSDLAGVFEYVENTGYFYLYDQARQAGQRVIAAIHVLSGRPDFNEADVEVRWTRSEEMVGLFIRGQLWAAFHGREKFGGDYLAGSRPAIPDPVSAAFAATA